MMTIRVDAKDKFRDIVHVKKDGQTIARGSVTLIAPGNLSRFRLVSHNSRARWEVLVPSRDAATASLTEVLVAETN